MGVIERVLSHDLHLALPESCFTQAAKGYPDIPLPQKAKEVAADFRELAGRGVLTLLDERQPEAIRVSFCTQRYELLCNLTAEQDAYNVIRLMPLSLRTHNLIARGAVRVAPRTWRISSSLAELQRQSKVRESGLEAIKVAWQECRQPVPEAQQRSLGLSPAHLTFLANVDTLIDMACQVELEQAARMERVPVRGSETTKSGGNLYRFQLNAPAPFRVGEFLRAGSGAAGYNGPGYDGTVAEVTGTTLTLRFRQPVDISALQKVEWLLPRKSTKQYTIQHEAVQALRDDNALNHSLLPLIVDNRFAAYDAPSVTGETTERPNPAQKTMIERALAVPDLLLALGPPGTGKTNTIREIVARQAALGKKVLVTSKNNKAVDNVLSGLNNVQAIRIGREDAVTPDVRPLLIDNMAATMRQKILGGIEPVQDMLDDVQGQWPHIQRLLERLHRLAAGWRVAESALEHEHANLATWQQRSYVRIEPVLERQYKNFKMMVVRATQTARRAENLRRRLEEFQKLSQTPVLGVLFIFLADQLAHRWQRVSDQYQIIIENMGRSRANTLRIWSAYEHFATASERALRRKLAVLHAQEAVSQVCIEISQALTQLSGLTEGLGSSEDMPPNSRDFSSPEALDASLQKWRKWYEMMMSRRALLSEWREALETRPDALYPALIRRADVVGATCIGIATDLRFEDLEFDMVIADEAGQIQVMDLLVPLVRARRAILVGDHLQLPPVVEPEIVEKIRENEPDNPALGEWLEKSLFERLIERPAMPDSNKVMLDTQYRMPRQIADFISGQFYDGNYHTGGQQSQADGFFPGLPLVFIDTVREPKHFEQRAEDGQGYSNAVEARVIADLFLAYQAKKVDVGVIVPYKKQAEVIRRELRRRQASLSEDDLLNRIATVDSFQGREQDVILFSFTRSNTEGRIGFLTELRRLNVSLTRARRQLVLVGDSSTLARTPDADFSHLFKSLLESVLETPKGYLHASDLAERIQIPIA